MTRGDLLLLIVVLSAFGVADSAYLMWQWYEAASAAWCDLDAFFSCTRVRESPWAAVGGVPTASIGVAGFAVLLALSVGLMTGRTSVGPWSTSTWLVVLAGLGVGIGAALTLVEVFVIQAICILCAFAFGIGLASFAAALPLARDAPLPG